MVVDVVLGRCCTQVPDSLKSRSLEGVTLESDERSQSSKMADRGPLERMFPGTYGARLLQVVIVVMVVVVATIMVMSVVV